MSPVEQNYLRPTPIMDADQEEVIRFAREITGGVPGDPRDMAVRLYYAVRDRIRYTPYYPFYRPEHYRASTVLRLGKGYCVPKAALLCTLGRVCGIPSRIGFAHVRNHLATKELIEWMGTDLFVYHGYTEFHINGTWVKATPAFNKELCQRHRVEPLAFDGLNDSVFQPYNLEKRLFMEYVEDLGTYADVPVEAIVAGWEEAYGKARVQQWIKEFETPGRMAERDFSRETLL